ncbi:MAG: PfkB family carbohydrate kinase [Halobaculum sp.]
MWVTPDGENRIAIVPGANGTVSAADAERAVETARTASVLLLQNEIPTEAARVLLDGLDTHSTETDPTDDGPLVVLDPAPATGARPLVDHPRVDVLVPNETEFETLRSSLEDARRRGATVVRTDGPGGAAAFDDGDESVENPLDTPSFLVETPEASVVDTTGAGDAFVGYLAAELADGGTLRAAVERGVRAGTRACEREGAMTAPRSEELRGRWSDEN